MYAKKHVIGKTNWPILKAVRVKSRKNKEKATTLFQVISYGLPGTRPHSHHRVSVVFTQCPLVRGGGACGFAGHWALEEVKLKTRKSAQE